MISQSCAAIALFSLFHIARETPRAFSDTNNSGGRHCCLSKPAFRTTSRPAGRVFLSTNALAPTSPGNSNFPEVNRAKCCLLGGKAALRVIDYNINNNNIIDMRRCVSTVFDLWN